MIRESNVDIIKEEFYAQPIRKATEKDLLQKHELTRRQNIIKIFSKNEYVIIITSFEIDYRKYFVDLQNNNSCITLIYLFQIFN